VAGQRFEDAVLVAAEDRAGTASNAGATLVLSIVTASTVSLATAAVVAIGLLRRAPRLGLAAAAVILATVAATQLLQWWLPRPVLLHHGYRRADQSFPSGHTATAMAVMCALTLVAPYRLRAVALGASSLFAGGIAVATVTASWHRPSDTLGGALVALAAWCAALALLARRGGVCRVPGPLPRALRALGALYTLAALAAVVAVLAGGPELLTGRAIAAGGAALTALAQLAVLGASEAAEAAQDSAGASASGAGRPSRARIAARRGAQLRYRWKGSSKKREKAQANATASGPPMPTVAQNVGTPPVT
jgi:membrane-associated phospholipid phosphatase